MGFNGPDATDYENVLALNHAWLELAQRDAGLQRGLDGMAVELRKRMTSLSSSQTARLAKTPFLLFSFREADEAYWTRTLAERPGAGLFDIRSTDDTETLISAALGFIWQLARRNPYALRVICGATLYWSERIAELTFFELLDAVRATGDPPVARFGEHRDLWRKLLGSGVSRQLLSCHAAQMTALQSILTHATEARQDKLTLAARSMAVPEQRIAKSNETTQT
ncbi:MAG: hypothetical protein ACR2Q3_07615 [Woeseiaceae bacterium]